MKEFTMGRRSLLIVLIVCAIAIGFQKEVHTMAEQESREFRLETVDHIGIYVEDLEKAIETWEGMFGIGPWAIRGRLAFAYTDNGVELELIQGAQGEGLHHLGWFVDDVDKAAAKAVARGAKVAFKGRGGNIHLDPASTGGVWFELMGRRGRITPR